MDNKGPNRERDIDRSKYYSDGYFQLPQLCSFAHQIHDIYRINPKSILEIGLGNGFTSTFLKRAGFDVVTADINPSLGPDLCCAIADLEKRLGRRTFDLVVCCEVLEHLPFDEFEISIKTFRAIGQRLYLTLPNYRRVFGFGGFLRLPKAAPICIRAQIEVPNDKPLDREHFWEVGSSKETGRGSISRVLRRHFSRVHMARYQLNPYHLSFFASET